MRRRVRRLLVAVLVVGTAVSGCTIGPSDRPSLAVYGGPRTQPAPSTDTSAPTSAPTGPGGPGRESDPIEWGDCPSGAVPGTGPGGTTFDLRCASVEVPVSYTADDSSSFYLEVARAAVPGSAGAEEDAPVLVVVDGPPGANGRDAVATVAESLPTAVREAYAVVTLDLRGTGGSMPATCVDPSLIQDIANLPPDPAAPGAADQLAELSRALTFTCTDVVGPVLSDLDSTAAADDLDTLRAALGSPTLTFLGTGAGATLGALYADRYPARVGRMVLDSPYDPMVTPSELATARGPLLAAALASFGGACPDFPDGCPLGDDPQAAVDALLTTLDADPLTARGLLIDAGTVLLMLSTRLGETTTWPELADALAAAADGDGDPLADLFFAQYRVMSGYPLFDGEIIYGCNDVAQRMPATEVATAAAALPDDDTFGRYLLGTVALCSTWPAPEHPFGRVTAAGAAPILVLGSVQDPTTPYEGAQALAGQLSSAELVSWQSGEHGAYPASTCVADTVDAYLVDGTPPAKGILCPP